MESQTSQICWDNAQLERATSLVYTEFGPMGAFQWTSNFHPTWCQGQFNPLLPTYLYHDDVIHICGDLISKFGVHMSTLEVVKYIDWMTSVSHNKLELIFIFLGGGDTLCVFWQPCASKGYYIRSFCVIPFKFRVLQMYITIVGIYSNMDCGDHGTQDRC